MTLLLSEQDVNLVGDNLEGKENAATRLLRVIIANNEKGDEVSNLQIIKAIESMNRWTSHVMTSWVEYHIHRLLLHSIIPIAGARTPAPQSVRDLSPKTGCP